MQALVSLLLLSISLATYLFVLELRPAAAGDPAKGKALYEKYCVACHGPQGKGDGPAGRMLILRAPQARRSRRPN